MIRLGFKNIAQPFLELINLSLRTGDFPSSCKQAKLIALSKIKVSLFPSDTLPISMITELSKILERMVFLQLMAYVNRNLLGPKQFCYKNGQNTQTALLNVLEDVRLAVEKRNVTLLVMFDFSKAFDCISHKLLLQKLHSWVGLDIASQLSILPLPIAQTLITYPNPGKDKKPHLLTSQNYHPQYPICHHT